ncbi:four helix bundle protein [bacterium]|nr:four helix bundle protein [bacterium]
MEKSKNYKDLVVWQKSMNLVVEIYKLTKKLPDSEIYGLVSQMRRCTVSIPSNIAEGQKRSTTKDFRKFLVIAYGSGGELETQLEIIERLYSFQKIEIEKAKSLLLEVMKMLNKLIFVFK